MTQPYRLQFPLNAPQVEQLDEMLQLLFDELAAVADSTSIEEPATTSTGTVIPSWELMGDDDNDFWSLPAGLPVSESPNIPRLNARTNLFVSDLTTQTGGLSITGTGVTTGRVVSITGSSATPGGQTDTGLVYGSALHVTGNMGSTSTNSVNRNSLVSLSSTINTSTASALNSTLRVGTTVSNTTNGSIIYGAYLPINDSTTLGNSVYGLFSDLSSSGNSNKLLYGLRSRALSSSTTANSLHGAHITSANSGAITSGSQSTYGLLLEAQSTNNNGGTADVYGMFVRASGSVTSGTLNTYGVRIGTPSPSGTTGTTKTTGLYIDDQTGMDTNYAIITVGGLVGINTASPAAMLSLNGGLHVGGDSDPGDNNALIDGTLDVTGVSTLTGVTIHGAPTRLKVYTVATLPAGTQGDFAFVTDALAPAYHVAVAGGGAVVVPVFYNGGNWIVN